VCEAVLASVACVNERSQTATKILSEGRPARVACQSRRSGHLRSALTGASRLQRNVPTGTMHRSPLRCSPRRQFSPDEVAHAHVHGGVQQRVVRSVRLALDTGAGVERLAQCTAIPRDLTTRRRRDALGFREDRDLSPLRRAVTFVRTRWGVSDPRPNGSGAASGGGGSGGRSRPASSISFIRAALEAAKERRLDDQHGCQEPADLQ
jgi:hypothetical protein